MQVRKRNGDLEPVDVNKIVRAVSAAATALPHVDPIRVASKTIGGLFDGATTRELDSISIHTAASLIAEEPEYSRLAARLLHATIAKEVAGQNIYSFSQSIEIGHREGVVSKEAADFVAANARKLNNAIDDRLSDRFEYFGLRTVYDRYLLKHPITRLVTETPQYFFMRVAGGLSERVNEAVDFYNLLASHDYLPSSPTLFNSGTKHSQMSSCYLHRLALRLARFDLRLVQNRSRCSRNSLAASASPSIASGQRARSSAPPMASRTASSHGCARSTPRSQRSIRAASARAPAASTSNPGTPTSTPSSRCATTPATLLAAPTTSTSPTGFPTSSCAAPTRTACGRSSIPRTFRTSPTSTAKPSSAPTSRPKPQGIYKRQVKARELYARMMRTLAETGNGWMVFKDACNIKCNQTGQSGNTVHLSNLCTEITEVTSSAETAVCNLGSINLGRHLTDGVFDFDKLAATVRHAVPMLDRVIDINYYPVPQAAGSNSRWRPVGLGVMGLQDVFFQMRWAFDSDEARALSAKIQEEIYFHALSASCDLAEKHGPHAAFGETRAAQGEFQFDLWGITPKDEKRWETLRQRMKTVGLRNSLLIAIAPTATIASIVGCYECIEPQISNMFKRETLSGEFMQINKYLVNELKALNLWSEEMRTRIKLAEGSIQKIDEIPAEVKAIYRTVWEVPMRSLIDMAADRGAFIDQSQSLNLFAESPNIGRLSSMYMYAWKRGIKTTYYLRSRPATKIAKTTVAVANRTSGEPVSIAAVACSLDNPESCEACQ